MKKVKSLILTLIMSFALGSTAYAATVETGDQNIDVSAKYQDSTTTATIYSVDVNWGAMQFTYIESGAKVWNPANHTYSDNTTAGWTANGNTVTVTNHSNADVTASFSFDALTAYDTVTGSFDVVSENLAAGIEGEYDAAESVTATLTLAGSLADTVTDYTRVGTITVKIN